MIVHKPRSVGMTEFGSIRDMTTEQIHTLFATPQRSLAARNFLALLEQEFRPVRCRIKVPVPHPLSVAVRSTIPGATNETSFCSN